MNKKIIAGIVVVLVVIAAVWYFSTDTMRIDCCDGSQYENGTQRALEDRNSEMEERLTQIITEVISENSMEGTILIPSGGLEVEEMSNGRIRGRVDLSCEDVVSWNTEKEIIDEIAERLYVEYPDYFSEDATEDANVDITGCSEVGTSPDGINTGYHNTRWGIHRGYAGFAV